MDAGGQSLSRPFDVRALQRRANKKNVIKCFESGYKTGSEISRVYKMTLFLYRSPPGQVCPLPFDPVREKASVNLHATNFFRFALFSQLSGRQRLQFCALKSLTCYLWRFYCIC